MIVNGEGQHYKALKKLPALITRMTAKHHSDFYCLNYLHSFATESKRKSHKKYVKIKDFVMLRWLLKTLRY